MLARCLGHIACRRGHSVLFSRADALLKRLKAARLDATDEQELRRLLRVDLLVLDDFALEAMGPRQTPRFHQGGGRAPPPPLPLPPPHPRPPGVAGPEGRPHARPVRGRPRRHPRLRFRPRRRVLPPPPEAPQVTLMTAV